mmetsp:Transcript_18246/g.42691  ORF Transcript_18246/g.42691 Transcript_18246/m.42691 type:complete len:459 (-) Transcript_18246:112-1488(-)|eukprot:CAMPEP_0178444248 /NCGR_PEP_ID=MMETSP0689_2-20121128/39381_1 /TAXON_ID=160604 /ORGANISM="Amphidinium massartii, Strain CS-259" /LENGTH=458 /DNA_ID=CAMNT_0020068417 /DNA_START=36 /DNA_END=1412 /DNA_ORIENTATION=+
MAEVAFAPSYLSGGFPQVSSFERAKLQQRPSHVQAVAPSADAGTSGKQSSGHSLSTGFGLLSCVGLATQFRANRRSSRQSSQCGSRLTTRRAFFDFNGGVAGADKKTVIVTGASSGLGLAAARELALGGEWHVILACRDFSKAEKAARDNNFPEDSYTVLHLDLACKSSVRRFVDSFRSLGRQLDCLVCNAAVYFPNAHKEAAILPGLFPGGGPRWSPDGMELSFATNYLGHFLLCKLLLPDLEQSKVKPARCVILGTVTATVNNKELGGQIPPKADIGNLEGLEEGMKSPITMVNKGAFDGAKAYKDSKVCDVMLMRELHRRYHSSTGIVFTSLYPGCIADTALFREHYPVFRALFPVLQRSVTGAYVSEPEAGKRLAQCVSDDRYAESGAYYTWGGESGTGGAGGSDAVENTEASSDRFLQYGSFKTLAWDEIGGDAGDNERCRKLWELSEKLCAH